MLLSIKFKKKVNNNINSIIIKKLSKFILSSDQIHWFLKLVTENYSFLIYIRTFIKLTDFSDIIIILAQISFFKMIKNFILVSYIQFLALLTCFIICYSLVILNYHLNFVILFISLSKYEKLIYLFFLIKTCLKSLVELHQRMSII